MARKKKEENETEIDNNVIELIEVPGKPDTMMEVQFKESKDVAIGDIVIYMATDGTLIVTKVINVWDDGISCDLKYIGKDITVFQIPHGEQPNCWRWITECFKRIDDIVNTELNNLGDVHSDTLPGKPPETKPSMWTPIEKDSIEVVETVETTSSEESGAETNHPFPHAESVTPVKACPHGIVRTFIPRRGCMHCGDRF